MARQRPHIAGILADLTRPGASAARLCLERERERHAGSERERERHAGRAAESVQGTEGIRIRGFVGDVWCKAPSPTQKK